MDLDFFCLDPTINYRSTYMAFLFTYWWVLGVEGRLRISYPVVHDIKNTHKMFEGIKVIT